MIGCVQVCTLDWAESRCLWRVPSCSSLTSIALGTGDTLVVDGAAWLWRPPAVPRGAVSRASRGVEAKSRAMGLAPKPKL